MLRHLLIALLFVSAIHAQSLQRLSVPTDSPRWELEGRAQVAEFQGRKAILLDGGAAVLKDFEMRDRVKKGSNELLLAVTEIGGGWGFICRLTDFKN